MTTQKAEKITEKRFLFAYLTLKTETLELVCRFVFAGTALSVISAILSSSTSENLEVEAMFEHCTLILRC